MYMMIALTIFREYPKETRLSYVKRYYDAISKHKINIPTPIMWVSELPFSSLRLVFWLTLMTPWIVFLVLIWPLVRYVAFKGLVSVSTLAGSVGSTVRSGERSTKHTGVVPFLKKFESTVRCYAHKMGLEVDQPPFTSPSDTKRSETSSSSRTTKGQKTTG